MEKVWLKNYPEGIPAEIDLDAYSSLKDILEHSCEHYRDYPAFANLGTSLTYADIDQQSRYFGAYLQKVAGLERGDRVALMMPNILQYPVALFGILRAGMVVVNVNPMYTAWELEHQMKDSGAKAIVILENFANTLTEAIDKTDVKTVLLTRVGDMLPAPKSWLVNFVVKHVKKKVPEFSLPGAQTFHHALAEGKWQTLDEVNLNHDDIAFLQYTGGTTGVAKGCILTHGNMVANLQQASSWLQPFVHDGEEIIITALPLYHIFSLTANCLVFMKAGGLNVLITDPRDMKSFVKTLGHYKFTSITGVNTLFNGLLHAPGFTNLDFSTLRMTLGGGMAVQKAVAERWKEVTGVTLVEAYGLTETAPAACINPLTLAEYNGSIGLPLPSTDISIRDEHGEELGFDQPGELWIKGPQVTPGYWNRPEETRKALTDDWLHTGDVASIDKEGFLRIVDRKKDMILVSGFNVYPNEVEGVIAMMPQVLEVAAVGVPDERSTEAVKVFIVKKDPSLTAEQVIEHCRKYMTRYKIPSYVEFREELPKSNVGKILRRALRDETITT